MEVQKRFEEMLVPVSKKIKNECNHSSKKICVDDLSFARLSFDLIKTELSEALDVIAVVNPSIEDWEKIREICRDFLNEQVTMLKNKYSMLLGEYFINGSGTNPFEKEIVAEYNTFIDGQVRSIVRSRKKFIFDILIKVISAIIGGIIVYLLTGYLML
jgi:hypothetical protein